MKHLTRLFGVLLIALLWMAAPASAQQAIDNTTLSAAISTPNATTPQPTQFINLTSVTCTNCTFGKDTLIYVDLEAMRVTGAYAGGTTNIPVTRGSDGTKPAAHKNAAVVMLGPGIRFHMAAGFPNGGDPPAGTCNQSSDYQGYKPWVNVTTGGSWVCDGNPPVWRVTYIVARTDNSRALSRLRSLVPDAVTAWVDSTFRW